MPKAIPICASVGSRSPDLRLPDLIIAMTRLATCSEIERRSSAPPPNSGLGWLRRDASISSAKASEAPSPAIASASFALPAMIASEVQPIERDGVVAVDLPRLRFRQAEIGEGLVEDLDPLGQVRRLQQDRIIARVDRALGTEGIERRLDIGPQIRGRPVRAGVRRQVGQLDPHVWVAREIVHILAELRDLALRNARLAAMIEDHRDARADFRHPLADEIHLRVVGVDVEGPAELFEQVHALDEAGTERQPARVLVELHDTADAADQRMLVAHLDEHRLDAPAPFDWRHGNDAPDTRIAPGLVLDELDFLNVLAPALPNVGVALKEHHCLDFNRTAVPPIVLDMVGMAEQRAALEGAEPDPGLVPDVQVRIDEGEAGHSGLYLVSLKLASTGFSVRPKPGLVSSRSMKPSLATGSPSKMYQKSSLPTSTGTLGKYSEIGPA